jgi:hypothetical protein
MPDVPDLTAAAIDHDITDPWLSGSLIPVATK